MRALATNRDLDISIVRLRHDLTVRVFGIVAAVNGIFFALMKFTAREPDPPASPRTNLERGTFYRLLAARLADGAMHLVLPPDYEQERNESVPLFSAGAGGGTNQGKKPWDINGQKR
jgi:hypothetical protein